MKNKVIAVVPAAGAGKRFNTSKKKTFAALQGVPVLVHTLKRLQHDEHVTEIIPALGKEDIEKGFKFAGEHNLTKIRRIAEGGQERQDSVFSALNLLDGSSNSYKYDLILVHDGVRPFIPEGLIGELVRGLYDCDGIIPGTPVKDTLKQVDTHNISISTIDREKLRAVQTPQLFHLDIIKKAYNNAHEKGLYATDDAALVEKIGGRIKIIPGNPYNIKVTTPEDLDMLEYVLRKKDSKDRN